MINLVHRLTDELNDRDNVDIDHLWKLLEEVRDELSKPTEEDMRAFGASDAACHLYPGEDQAGLREAYCRGAADTLKPYQPMHIAYDLTTWADALYAQIKARDGGPGFPEHPTTGYLQASKSLLRDAVIHIYKLEDRQRRMEEAFPVIAETLADDVFRALLLECLDVMGNYFFYHSPDGKWTLQSAGWHDTFPLEPTGQQAMGIEVWSERVSELTTLINKALNQKLLRPKVLKGA